MQHWIQSHIWSGTFKPNGIYSWALRILFWSYMHVLRWLGCSPLVLLRSMMRMMKPFHTTCIKNIRTPMLGCIMPSVWEPHKERMYIWKGIPVFAVYEDYPQRTDVGVVYIHGGGFVSGDYGGYQAMLKELQQRTHMDVWFPHYRLCPENMIRDAVQDVRRVLLFVAAMYHSIWVIADSAGANLALLALPVTGVQGVCLFSPVADLECKGASYVYNHHKDCMLKADVVKRLFSSLVTSKEEAMTYSALHRNLSHVPTTHIWVGSDEIMLDDAVGLCKRIPDANVYVMPKGIHVAPLFWACHPEGDDVLDQAAKCLRSGDVMYKEYTHTIGNA